MCRRAQLVELRKRLPEEITESVGGFQRTSLVRTGLAIAHPASEPGKNWMTLTPFRPIFMIVSYEYEKQNHLCTKADPLFLRLLTIYQSVP